ncbi:MAG: M48 family metallopeptidase [Thermococcus sp.]|uniref:M48 family metallopeptidase n=1 Tax=Thermococcus sp. TaxID=35749 RepID=UPI001D23E5A1|nr:M48 family metallopeptidase [Thermococcus sp.]MBO8174242.1 M48 family metallopeptidase [Thermococcus sp.]
MHEIEINGKKIKYELILRPVRYVRIYVQPEGYLRIVSPTRNVRPILKSKEGWILKNLEKVEKGKILASRGFPLFGKFYEVWSCQRTKIFTDVICVSNLESLKRIIKKELKKKMEEIIEKRAEQIGRRPNKVFIRVQRNKWGSCSSKGNLSLNITLAALPEELLDYVITHELAHLVELNHSKRFWKLVAKAHPDYKKKREELKLWWVIVNNNELWKKILGE